jgi:hypothetical protein
LQARATANPPIPRVVNSGVMEIFRLSIAIRRGVRWRRRPLLRLGIVSFLAHGPLGEKYRVSTAGEKR